MRLAKAKHVLSIFDSCFSGTIFSARAGAAPAAITRKTTKPVRQFITSGDAGQQVRDDGSFREYFLRAIRGDERADVNNDGYVTGEELGLFMNQKVSELTRDAQTPRSGKLHDVKYNQGDFVFATLTKTVRSAASAKQSAPAASRSGFDQRQLDLSFWQTIQNSKDPAMFDAYLQQFPKGTFAPLARLKRDQLLKKRGEQDAAQKAKEEAARKAREAAERKRKEEVVRRNSELEKERQQLAAERTRLEELATKTKEEASKKAREAEERAKAKPQQLAALTPSQTGKPGWHQVENQANCSVWNANPQPNETVTWTGACVNGRAHGLGTSVWRYQKDGAWKTGRYEGERRFGRANGQGTYVWASGNKYDGEWKDGKKHGRGVYVDANGFRYDGEFKHGKRHGRGVSRWSGGNKYDGEWKDNWRTGQGVFTFASGDWCDGEWRANKLVSTGSGERNGSPAECYGTGTKTIYFRSSLSDDDSSGQ